MTKKPFLVSIAAGLGGLGLLHLYLERLEHETAGGTSTEVLVAARNIAPGEVLTRELLGFRRVPEAYVLPRQVLTEDVARIVGVALRTGLEPGEHLLFTDLSQGAESHQKLSELVQPGQRAFTLPGSTAFSGLLQPGDRVDVLFTPQGDGKNQTSTLLQNLLVLAVNGKTKPHESASNQRGGSATLSVGMEQAQRLTQAERHGTLTLVLRHPDDIEEIRGLPATSGDDLGAPPRREATRPGNASTKTREIEHVR
jgi:Flp pilus assembly protein CpaB